MIKVTGLMICTGRMLLRLIHGFERRGLMVDVRFEEEYRTREVRELGFDVRCRCHMVEPLKAETW